MSVRSTQIAADVDYIYDRSDVVQYFRLDEELEKRGDSVRITIDEETSRWIRCLPLSLLLPVLWLWLLLWLFLIVYGHLCHPFTDSFCMITCASWRVGSEGDAERLSSSA
jgi:hypothetical protein